MSENLKQRIITALIGVPAILLLLTSLGVEGVAFFAWVISCGMLFEFSKMFLKLEDARFKIILLLGFNSLVHALNYWFSVGISGSFLGLAPVFFFFLAFLFLVPRVLNYGGSAALSTEAGVDKLLQHLRELMALCFGWVYCGWFPLLMVSIRTAPSGKHWLILTLVIVWASDTFAYFSGKYFGKRMFFETVSPKKTWEGFIGGTVGAVLVALFYSHFYLPDEDRVMIVFITLALSVAAAMGDLCESLLKRAVSLKDSGSILPGHGGFLDRFDGVVFALPVMYAILWMIF